jgi:hypothetical protein
MCAVILPLKTYPPLIIDTNTVLTGTITFKCLKMIPRRYSQIIKPSGNFKLSEFAPCNFGDL